MNRESRTRLRRVVYQARTLLEEDVKTQLNRLGIEEGGNVVPIGRLVHLGSKDSELRDKILASIKKEQGKRIELNEAYDRYIRHVGFTYLNRIAALRAMEVRGLLEKETVIRRDKYAGLSEKAYEISEHRGISNAAESTRLCFFETFQEVSQEIRVLFDVNDEYSVLFPSPGVLEKVIQLTSIDVPAEDWNEEDIIGWIYQYYNSKARSEFREKRKTPRPDDIPAINQFYTPRWLVRALVDNTLGRLWLEMKGRNSSPAISKTISEERLKAPQGETVEEYCSYCVPIEQNQSQLKKKSVREIKVLDPACGSGHFLVYAFSVLYRMYLEDEPETPRQEIPQLILENNLFGIDIDLRSVQLAALSLFLKAKEYNPSVKISKMNLVCADVRLINGELRKEFLSRLENDLDLQRIFTGLFTDLEFTYDVGGLLKIRPPFERLIEERRGGVQTKFSPTIMGQSFFSQKGSIEGQSGLFNEEQKKVSIIKPAVTLEEMLDALLEFEREGMEKKDMGTILFAAEAEKSVGLLSILSKKYDVVVMNPPYGKMPSTTKDYAKDNYPRTYYDYYAAFIEQAVNLCENNGFLGMLTGRTFMFLKRFEKVRTEILLKEARSEIIFDLNSSPSDNILDEATGRWAGTVARKVIGENNDSECIFFRLVFFDGEEKKIDALEKAIRNWPSRGNGDVVYSVKLSNLKKLPGMPYSYWIPESLIELFNKYPPLDKVSLRKHKEPKIADLKQGLASGDDYRFVRRFWEIKADSIGRNKRWVPYAKGGNKFYTERNFLINWENDGEVYHGRTTQFSCLITGNRYDYMYKAGLSWEFIVSTIWLEISLLPENVIFSDGAQGLFPVKPEFKLPLLGWGNSILAAYLFFVLNPTMHSRHIGYVSSLPVAKPVLESNLLGMLAKEAHDILREWATGNEVSTLFIKPWILQTLDGFVSSEKPITKHPLSEQFEWSDWEFSKKIRGIKGSREMKVDKLAGLCIQWEGLIKDRLEEIQRLIDQTIFGVYDIKDEDIKIIKEELEKIQNCFKFSKNGDSIPITPEPSTKDHVIRMISYYVKIVVEENPSGIVLFDELLVGVRQKIAETFGKEQEQRVETEIAAILNKSLNDWLKEDFFEFHVSLCERRPIFWHLTSASFSPRKGSNGTFNCILNYHKVGRDTLAKVKTKQQYLKGILDGTRWRTEGLRKELQKNSSDIRKESHIQAEYIEAQEQLTELQAFDQKLAEVSNPRAAATKLGKNTSWVEQKIAEVRDNGWNPVIDYGVRVNIEPLKEARLLHPAADRVK